MTNETDFFAIAVSLKLPVKGVDIEKLLLHCQTYENIFYLSYSDAEKILQRKFRFQKYRRPEIIKKTETICHICRLKKIRLIHITDNTYTRFLKEIYDYPFLLYYLGTQPDQGETILSIVGTRNPTMEGYQLTMTLASACSESHITTVSGMAFGIDSAVHWGSLDVKGKTVVVMGCGIDICYPKKNKKLYQQILENNGTILSEYPPGFAPQKWTFPCRNRIIAGLSRSLLITEAPAKSGAMITAQNALDNNRDIYVQKYNNYSEQRLGNLSLLEQGACGIKSEKDLLCNLLPDNPENAVNVNKDNSLEISGGLARLDYKIQLKAKKIINILTDGIQNTETILTQTGFSQIQLHHLLFQLEKSGIIKRIYGNCYSLQN